MERAQQGGRGEEMPATAVAVGEGDGTARRTTLQTARSEEEARGDAAKGNEGGGIGRRGGGGGRGGGGRRGGGQASFLRWGKAGRGEIQEVALAAAVGADRRTSCIAAEEQGAAVEIEMMGLEMAAWWSKSWWWWWWKTSSRAKGETGDHSDNPHTQCLIYSIVRLMLTQS
ncbi:hypothetical protein PR202_gb00597 [Eleusine coracana subsp. coracana]|uniref:Uncharacterized protein n=1 Tax=Eleusine coracana subsp. coracana TaxID=191504 RepID=A0AAV5DUB7_ELECO|nr:hypothetical protein PR202_gb00597 [Eleusine coracana subsp. coracana]